MQQQKPLLEIILKSLVALDPNKLLALILFILRTEVNNKKIKINTKIVNVAELQLLLDIDQNIVAFEILFYCHRQLIMKKNKTVDAIVLPINLASKIEEYPLQVIEHLQQIQDILQRWFQDPQRIETIISLLTKLYKKQITILEELMQSSITTMEQITNFGIILNSQLVTMKNMIKKSEDQKKSVTQLAGSAIDKHTLVIAIDRNKQQLDNMAILEQHAFSKIFPALIKKLKHDHDIFYSKYRFMEEEFKIFLQERCTLGNDLIHSELTAANIYDLLKKIQYDITQEIEFGSYHA